MRDPKRIDELMPKLTQFWHQVPDWRFCQLMSNLMGFVYTDTNLDPWFIEDDKFEELLDTYIQKYKE